MIFTYFDTSISIYLACFIILYVWFCAFKKHWSEKGAWVLPDYQRDVGCQKVKGLGLQDSYQRWLHNWFFAIHTPVSCYLASVCPCSVVIKTVDPVWDQTSWILTCLWPWLAVWPSNLTGLTEAKFLLFIAESNPSTSLGVIVRD